MGLPGIHIPAPPTPRPTLPRLVHLDTTHPINLSKERSQKGDEASLAWPVWALDIRVSLLITHPPFGQFSRAPSSSAAVFTESTQSFPFSKNQDAALLSPGSQHSGGHLRQSGPPREQDGPMGETTPCTPPCPSISSGAQHSS